MRKLVATLLAVAAWTWGAPGAHANHVIVTGGCTMVVATDQVAGEGQQTGIMVLSAVARQGVTSPLHNGYMECWVRVNGVEQADTFVGTFATTVFYAVGVITYTSASVTDYVEVCERVDYDVSCEMAVTYESPPPLVKDVVDPSLCWVLAAAAGDLGPVYIDSQGDLWLDGEPYYDCPPHDQRGGPAHLTVTVGTTWREAVTQEAVSSG